MLVKMGSSSPNRDDLSCHHPDCFFSGNVDCKPLLLGGFKPFEEYELVSLDHFPSVEINKIFELPPPIVNLKLSSATEHGRFQ